MFEVVSIEQDLAGKFYARVVMSPEETQFFKFDHEPTQVEIDEAAARFLALREGEGAG